MKQRYTNILAFAMSVMMTAGLASCGSSDSSVITDSSKGVTNGPVQTQPVTTGGDTSLSSPAATANNDLSGAQKDRSARKQEVEAAGEMNDMENYDGVSASNTVGADIQNTESYADIEENSFKLVSEEPVSTFSTDVDTASYANARRLLSRGSKVYPNAVRAEEFINYFSYDYNKPEGDTPIALTTELSDCPWNENTKLLLVGVQAKDIIQEKRPAMNLVLLIDVSGSMNTFDKLPLAVSSFKMLAEELDANDRISIVTYSGEEKTVLDGATGAEYDKISNALDSLYAGGSTAGEAGINMAYSLAEKHFIKGGNNRIVMATDGDLNVGISSVEDLTALVEKKREGGVFLSVLGFGTGNLKDDRLEALADNGNGNYSYIDCEKEAYKVLVEEMNSTLYTVAKDVKAQIEFDPESVAAYRLVGYENRALSKEDFTDDKKDAGDMGAGHSSTALFEIVPAAGVLGSTGADFLELGDRSENAGNGSGTAQTDHLLTVKLRYKQPDGDTSKEISSEVSTSTYQEKAPANLAFASCAAEFAMYLRQSEYSKLTLDMIKFQLTDDLLTDDYRQEFKSMLRWAENIYGE